MTLWEDDTFQSDVCAKRKKKKINFARLTGIDRVCFPTQNKTITMPIDYRGFWKTYYIWIRLDEMPITLSKWKSKFKNKLYYEIVYTISWRIRMLRLQEFDRMTKVSSTR